MDVFSFEKRSAVMASIRSGDTRCEWIVRRFLFSHGYRYRIHDKRLVGKPDIVLPKYRTVIFVHGCFWHGHNGCQRATRPKTNREFWEKKITGNIERDKRCIRSLRQDGWSVLVVWQCQTKDINLLQKRLSRFIMR